MKSRRDEITSEPISGIHPAAYWEACSGPPEAHRASLEEARIMLSVLNWAPEMTGTVDTDRLMMVPERATR